MADDAVGLRQALTLELLRAQMVTGVRTLQAMPRVGMAPAVPSSMAGACDLTGVFMAEVSAVDGGAAYE